MKLSPEFWEFMVGPELGRGASRVTYALKHDAQTVLKVCDPQCNGNFRQNLLEWEAWDHLRTQCIGIRKWFAPCIDISPCGRLLLQARTQKLDINKLPEKLPAFLDDFNRDNFGMIDGQVVARDYGTLMLWAFSDNVRTKAKREKKVRWYE